MNHKTTLKPWEITYRGHTVKVEPDGWGGFTYADDDTIDTDVVDGEVVCSGILGHVSRNTTIGGLLTEIRESVDEWIEKTGESDECTGNTN